MGWQFTENTEPLIDNAVSDNPMTESQAQVAGEKAVIAGYGTARTLAEAREFVIARQQEAREKDVPLESLEELAKCLGRIQDIEEKVDRTTRLLKKFLGEFRFKEAQMIAENQDQEVQDDPMIPDVDGMVEDDAGLTMDPDELIRRAMSRTLTGPRFAEDEDDAPAEEEPQGDEEGAVEDSAG